MNTVEILQAAKEHLIENGWCKQDLWNAEGQACAMGALFSVGKHGAISRAMDFLIASVPTCSTAGYRTVPGFNDDPDVGFNEVMGLYDNAILLAKEAEAA